MEPLKSVQYYKGDLILINFHSLKECEIQEINVKVGAMKINNEWHLLSNIQDKIRGKIGTVIYKKYLFGLITRRIVNK